MKALRYGISCLLVSGFAFVAACGGSADDNTDSVGTGGKSSASGGRSGTGTAAGAPGVPGGVMNNPACPASAPANAGACTPSNNGGLTCDYTGMRCACARMRGGGGMRPGGTAGAASTATGAWQCTETLVCPATQPNTGDACTPAAGGGDCPYSGGNCTCSARSSKWSCIGVGGPGGGFGGGFNGAGGFNFGTGGFSFGTGGFNFGTGGRSFGNGGSGTTGGTACPATKPAADTACTGDASCPYTGGGCVCSSDKWTCL